LKEGLMTIRHVMIAVVGALVFLTLGAATDDAFAARKKAAATCSGIPPICPPFQTAACVKGHYVCRALGSR
jgi:hypothetical protein